MGFCTSCDVDMYNPYYNRPHDNPCNFRNPRTECCDVENYVDRSNSSNKIYTITPQSTVTEYNKNIYPSHYLTSPPPPYNPNLRLDQNLN